MYLCIYRERCWALCVCVSCTLHPNPLHPDTPKTPHTLKHFVGIAGHRGVRGGCEGGRRRCYTSWEPPASFFASLYQWRPLLSSPASPPPDGRERVGEEA